MICLCISFIIIPYFFIFLYSKIMKFGSINDLCHSIFLNTINVVWKYFTKGLFSFSAVSIPFLLYTYICHQGIRCAGEKPIHVNCWLFAEEYMIFLGIVYIYSFLDVGPLELFTKLYRSGITPKDHTPASADVPPHKGRPKNENSAQDTQT